MNAGELNKIYDVNFYKANKEGSLRSAAKVIPYVIKCLEPMSINSVVDFGCGIGGWLRQFSEINPNCKILGLDGGNANKDQMLINPNQFRKVDLSEKIALEQRFDMAISLEVAEHLPESAAEVFIDNICSHSDIILFSAAIPGQGGNIM